MVYPLAVMAVPVALPSYQKILDSQITSPVDILWKEYDDMKLLPHPPLAAARQKVNPEGQGRGEGGHSHHR